MNVNCDLCKKDVKKENCIILKQNTNLNCVCKECRPDLINEIDFLWKNKRLKIVNLPVKVIK
jgi:hypothetical protein